MTATVQDLDLDLDNRTLPMDRAQDEEEDLARMLITAGWYVVLARTSIGFAFTVLVRRRGSSPGRSQSRARLVWHLGFVAGEPPAGFGPSCSYLAFLGVTPSRPSARHLLCFFASRFGPGRSLGLT
ncbi:hypothetical protein [Streptomyces sp. NPDC055992]|uniref:hypothetical protein n=1 Tax=Streptomyces sp. NPDC055992 TaxID=3345673 RepID=UPI0035D9D728